MNDELLLEFIDYLETQELKLLTWGIVDFSFSEDNFKAIISSFINEKNLNIDEIDFQELLIERKLLFEFYGSKYRTRTAETVRLIAKLKQLFPNHMRNNSWSSAKNLVGDFRFIKRKRQRPNRTQYNYENLLRYLTESGVILTNLQTAVLKGILGTRTLAGFQVRAIKNILSPEVDNNVQKGILISAGTGSGKTLAFYIPVLLSIVKTLEMNRSAFTKCIAIYPRTELLKDQLVELLNLIRIVNPILKQNKLRPIRLGAFFGMTPNNYNDPVFDTLPKHAANGVIIPYLKCPLENCNGSLFWSNNNRTKNEHTIKCTELTCGYSSGENEIALTRSKIISSPPDILFTTTEMMNRHLANYNSSTNKIWGIGQEHKPGFILFDEVHTYSGNHGAAVSYLLKRYSHFLKSKPVITGLSATLKEGKKFFSRFSNIDESFVTEVFPDRSEMVRFGSEYKMVLRNDPLERAQLLSTTIQLLMLIRRAMDPSGKTKYFGDKVFAFTDDLDVTNRLFHNLNSAEAMRLPSLRKLLKNEELQRLANRFESGQYWKLSEEIGFDLGRILAIDRTSSQDSGVMEKVDVVVATAALEVGYNDKGVGAVIQHKTPRSTAQLIQREGRAGRTDYMRPWTIVVLSDFGIDRSSFQSYERLFDPELELNRLPLDNLYIIKIQAVYSFMEWISLRLHLMNFDSHIWDELRYRRIFNQPTREQINSLIKNVLNDEIVFCELKNHLIGALSINEYTLERVLWEAPRSLMLHVIPTLLRRLEKNWEGEDYQISQKIPLTDFIPSTLFTDLNLPELEIKIPAQNQQDNVNVERMGFFQGINEYAPGNVSARFTINRAREKHWIRIPYNNPEPFTEIDVNQFIRMDDIIVYGKKSVLSDDNESADYLFIRPQCLTLEIIPNDIKDYSSAYLKWQTTIESTNPQSFNLHIPDHPVFKAVFCGIDVHLHSGIGQLTVDRFAIGVTSTTTISRPTEKIEKDIKFISSSFPNVNIAYGTRMYVDGIKVRFIYPENLDISNNDLRNHLRLQYFRYRLRTVPNIGTTLNIFDLELLEEFIIYIIVNEKFNNQRDINIIIDLIHENLNDYINQYTTHFGDRYIDRLDAEPQDNNDHTARLISILNQIGIDELTNLLSTFNVELNDSKWIKTVYKSTLGVIVLESIKRLVKDVMDNDLLLDLNDGLKQNIESGEDYFYISESSPGSMGIIERFVETYNEDPSHFYKMLISIASPEDDELINTELNWLLHHALNGENKISHCFNNYRNTDAIDEKEKQINIIAKHLREYGRISSHTIISSLSNRILFPGSNNASDNLINDAHVRWSETENALGFEIEPRIFSEVLSNNPDMRDRVIHMNAVPQDDRLINSAFYRFLWPKGGSIRNKVLSSYNPFATDKFTDKLILNELFAHHQYEPIEINNGEQREILDQNLTQNGVAVIRLKENDQASKGILHNLIVNPVEDDVLFDYPRITRIKKQDGSYFVELTSGISR